MDSFYRLMLIALLIAVVHNTSVAHAEVQPPPEPFPVYCFNGVCAETACAAAGFEGCINASLPDLTPGNGPYACTSAYNCATAVSYWGCASGFEYQNGSCVGEWPIECDPGFMNEGGSCVPDCGHDSRNLGGAPYGGTGSLPSSICVSGCEYPLNSGVSGCKGGTCYFEASVGAPSGACSEPSDVEEKGEDNRTPEEQCISNGQGYVSTGGIVTCVGAGTPGGGDITVTEPSFGDSGSTVPPTFKDDGGVDTDGDGESDKSKREFCDENPSSPGCRSVFTGYCDAFRCEGDAIQCAIAYKQHQTVCDMKKPDPVSELGRLITQGQDGFENPLDNPAQISLDSLDTSSFMPKGGLQDMSFSIVGQSFTLPLSNLNAGLQFAGYIVLAFTFIAAARIVFM